MKWTTGVALLVVLLQAGVHAAEQPAAVVSAVAATKTSPARQADSGKKRSSRHKKTVQAPVVESKPPEPQQSLTATPPSEEQSLQLKGVRG